MILSGGSVGRNLVLVMTFNCRRRVNIAMAAKLLTGCETEMHIWKYG